MKLKATKKALWPSQRSFLTLLQSINFGRIENLRIHNGQPQLIPKPRVLRSVRIGGLVGPRPEVKMDDFALKSQIVEMFEHFNQIGDGTIARLDIKDGLPCHLVIEESDRGGE